MSDYKVTIKITNARLWRAIQKAGYRTLAAFARANHLSYAGISRACCLKEPPYRSDGNPTDFALGLSAALRCEIEDLFPPAMLQRALPKNIVSFEVEERQIVQLIDGSPRPDQVLISNDTQEAIGRTLATLNPRLENIIRMRFGIECEPHTLDEIGKKLGISSKERVRQLEVSALRRLAHHSRSNNLRRDVGEFVSS